MSRGHFPVELISSETRRAQMSIGSKVSVGFIFYGMDASDLVLLVSY